MEKNGVNDCVNTKILKIVPKKSINKKRKRDCFERD